MARPWPGPKLPLLVLVLAAAACVAEGEAGPTTGEASSTAGTRGDEGSETGVGLSGWPEEWYADYHEDPGITIGITYLMPVLLGPLDNMRLEAGSVTIERFDYTVGGELETWVFATERDGDALRLLPPDGEWDVLYPGAERVLLRPGDGCDEVVLEAYGLPPPYEPVFATRWWRGRLCVVDPYDESLADDAWMVDLCPRSVVACEG